MSQELQLAIAAARHAGALTQSYFSQRSFEVFTKRDRTPVTVADREAEALIVAAIREQFPDDGILGEESGERPSLNGRRWVIDPIDGTRSFIHGVPLYGVMIALEVAGELLLGVINFPALGELYHAERGSGAFCNDERIRVSSIAEVEAATVLYTEKEYLLDPLTEHPVDRLRQEAGLVRNWGDCYGHMLVASGRAEVAVDKVMSYWDCAAIIPIVAEAGGCSFDYRGRRTGIAGEDGLVSANAVLGEQLLAAL